LIKMPIQTLRIFS